MYCDFGRRTVEWHSNGLNLLRRKNETPRTTRTSRPFTLACISFGGHGITCDGILDRCGREHRHGDYGDGAQSFRDAAECVLSFGPCEYLRGGIDGSQRHELYIFFFDRGGVSFNVRNGPAYEARDMA